jgi:hypothetical protein
LPISTKGKGEEKAERKSRNCVRPAVKLLANRLPKVLFSSAM